MSVKVYMKRVLVVEHNGCDDCDEIYFEGDRIKIEQQYDGMMLFDATAEGILMFEQHENTFYVGADWGHKTYIDPRDIISITRVPEGS